MTVYKDNGEALEGLGYDSHALMDELIDRVSSQSSSNYGQYKYHNQFYRLGFLELYVGEIIDECIIVGIDLKKYKKEN